MNEQKPWFGVVFPVLSLSIVLLHAALPAAASRVAAQTIISMGGSLEPARLLLKEKNFPLEPEMLREKGWRKKMRPIFDEIPEMKQNIRHGSKISGLLLGKNLYFPEKVEYIGPTLIIAENIMFEGLDVEIWGKGALFIFPISKDGVLGKSLEEAVDEQVAKLSWDQTFEDRLNLFSPVPLQTGFRFSVGSRTKRENSPQIERIKP